MLWFLTLPAVWLAWLSLVGERARLSYIRTRLSAAPRTLPRASVIVPVKGADDDLTANLAALATLDYPDYELIVAARTASDIPPGVLPSRVKVAIAGTATSEASEKVQNLVAGVRAARQSSSVLAFADSDGRVQPDWLRALVAPLDEEGVGASTGYRWYVPRRKTPANLLRGVWNGVIAGRLGPGDSPFAWGGAMAITRRTFGEAYVREYWMHAVSDDYSLTSAVRMRGLTIAYAPGATVACSDSTGWFEFAGWTRRQLMLTRVHQPRLWQLAFAGHIIYCIGMAAALVALIRGQVAGGWLLAAQLVPGMFKGALRARSARTALPEYRAWFARWGWTHTLFVPLATWWWMLALALSAFGNTIRWRGREYRLPQPDWESGPR